MSLVIRPATAEDILAWCEIVGCDPAGKPSARAWVGEIDGRIVGIGGVALAKGRWFGFVDLTEEIRPYKMTIMRAAIRFLDDARRRGTRYIYAEVSPIEPRAGEWLASLGFHLDPRSEQLYRWSARTDA